MSDCFVCVKKEVSSIHATSSIRAVANIIHNNTTSIKCVGKLNPNGMRQPAFVKTSIKLKGSIRSKANLAQNICALSLTNNGNIRTSLKFTACGIRSRISSKSKFTNKYVDKFGGYLSKISSIDNFIAIHKLYPIKDIETSLNNSYFVDKYLSSGSLYQSIDEGIFIGNYQQNLKSSKLISDDNESFIQPSSIFTNGTFRYKCEVTRPYHHPKESFLFIRASAPVANYGSDIAPEYRIHNIRLEDPHGNLIIKYKDINLRGDSNYSNNNINFTTYISEPEINNALLHTWDSNYPSMVDASGYTLNLDFDAVCLDDPFSRGFDFGYEEKACNLKFVNQENNNYLAIDGSPLSTQTQGYHLNPTNSLRISAIEICNSGDLCNICEVSGIKNDNRLSFYLDVNPIGQRLIRNINPVELLLNSYDTNIYPHNLFSKWISSPDSFSNIADNTSVSGSKILLSKILNTNISEYITLDQNSPSVDSGRLLLRFSHQTPQSISTLSDGAFSFGDDSFDSSELQTLEQTDNLFEVDSIELKIIAKKAVGSRDYALDIVGYSDDNLLNITPKIGAFLQNTVLTSALVDENNNFVVSELEEFIGDVHQVGNIPLVSGFKNINELAISSETLSDKSQYYEKSISNEAGDHYALSTTPVINSTSFQEYTIPLTIYKNQNGLGLAKDFSFSSFFENLYLDIYPIPSGASIANISLVVNFKPSNGILLHTIGTQTNKEIALKNINLLPIGINDSDDTVLNTYFSLDTPLSIISGIPQSYSETPTIKTNYSRRWRGVDGIIVNGPYDPNEFDFSFFNKEADHPFLNGLFDFTNIENNFVTTQNHPYYENNNGFIPVSGYYNGLSAIIKNLGLRFNNSSLFPFATNHTTTDWTTSNDPLYGKILDAFDSTIRLSGIYGNINFGNVPAASGFAIYLRFTPDYNMSGVGYNLFNSGVLFSKWDQSNNLELSLGFENGYLTALANDATNGIIKLQDSQTYDNYQYPLSILLTYDKNPNGTLRLYCNNELTTDSYLRNSYEPLSLIESDSDLVFGYSYGSGIGCNIFAHEIGISSSGNIVDSNPNKLFKQTTASSFLDGHSLSFAISANEKFKLHQYIDDNVSNWKLGAFKTCFFSPDFDGFTKRIGSDYLAHNLNHHGSGYLQITNLTIPSSIITSGLAYHTQIENDFLRFNIQDIPDVNPEFYSVFPRISKNIPRGYNFVDNALVVDTILEHETNNELVWPNGDIGPKLIVSLYTKNKEPVDRPSKVNWGLVNRSIHYLEPSGCYTKVSSTFNYNDLINKSEPWALFDLDNIVTEFDQKYYSDDINDMFLQYDLAYPSGSPFNSTIKIHSANIRLDNTLTHFANKDASLNLYSSGDKIALSDINLYTYGKDTIYAGIDLYASGSAWPDSNSNINLYVSGIYGVPNSQFNLFIKNSGALSELGPDLYVSGGYPRDEKSMSLVMTDNTSIHNIYQTLPILVNGKGLLNYEDSLSLFTAESLITRNIFSTEIFNLYTHNQQLITNNVNNNFNLYILTDLDYQIMSDSLSLFTINYPAFNQNVNQQASISWDQNNVGKSIDTFDNNKAFLEANDEIRGVDLLCYGSCSSEKSCKEDSLVIHDTSWYQDNSCVDGGIFRAKNTYTNLDVSGFKTPIGYSGHFYGIRKYDGLIPNAPYSITITSQTGSNVAIDLPRQFVEVNYGSNDYVNYSGVKLTPSQQNRLQNNRYGKSVSLKNDLIAIGSPNSDISYSEYQDDNLVTSTLYDAGEVYLYRRLPRPSGYSWPINEDRSDWDLETILKLPSGILKDYPTKVKRNTISNITLPSPVFENFWNVGQEGRKFGYSLDLAINSNIKSFQSDRKEIIAVGAPYASWNRDFEDLQTSGVSIGILLFTDEFAPTVLDPNNAQRILSYNDVLNSIQGKDLLFQYFSDPPVKFDVKLIICQPISDLTNRTLLDFPEPKPSFITKTTIPRNQGIENENDRLAIFSGIKQAFELAYPYNNTKLNNNIPVMLGVYVDNSRSLGRQAVGQGLDTFLSYYQSYSFASGLKDFNNVSSSGAVYEYFADTRQSENWISLSITAIDNLLDTGRLVRDNQVRFFSSNIGPSAFNENLSEFNHPPPSGGRVYVFEKESGVWNLIQELKSSISSYDSYDIFGHSVAISEDTNVIAVGSPYTNEACKIYQYNDDEKIRLYNNLYNWLTHINSFYGGLVSRYSNLINDYADWSQVYGQSYANQILYSKLTPTEKFEARKYLNIEEYANVFTYRYSDIPYVGTWDFIPETFAPTSRLGYSVAVNDDGSTVAFGAPTDSFNAFDDYNIYYKNDGYEDPLNIDGINGPIKSSWRSNVNAGAVRLFESRDYYPHNSVVEFRKFGNLQEQNILDSGHFNYISNIFQDKNFRKTDFEEVSIPKDAGLAFIITPEIDAISDEIIDNIYSWLSLGDRNLVLVGNDPVWEENGKYEISNTIINKILDRLNSRMRLYPAKNSYEALSSGNSQVLPSFRPQNGTESYLRPSTLNTAYGVADIRMHFPGYSKFMPCSIDSNGLVGSSFGNNQTALQNLSLNDKCELPLIHRGDLRAQWIDACPDFNCGSRLTQYPVNWPFIFKTYTPNCCALFAETINQDRFDLANKEPIPILAAAETINSTRVIPAVPAKYAIVPIFETKTAFTSTQSYIFDDSNINSPASFIWDSGNNNSSSYEININDSEGELFYTPTVFENRQPVLQAQAYPISDILYGTELISNISRYCVKQDFGTSQIIAIAGTATESASVLLSGAGDDNINFYANLVSSNVNGGSRIAQLGSWTGRDSFASAQSDSILAEIFKNSGNDVEENVNNISVAYNVCWIANPINLPSNVELINLQSWLNSGNKRLIITHDSSVTQILIVKELLSLLNSNITPTYLTVKEEYPLIRSGIFQLNPNTFVADGFGIYRISNFPAPATFVPFDDHPLVTTICHANTAIYDTKLITDGYWKINSGINKISFPAIPGSGYKIFIQTVSETLYENQPLDFHISNVSEKAQLPPPQQLSSFMLQIDEYKLENLNLTKTVIASSRFNNIQTTSFNVQVPLNKNTIDFNINSFISRINTQEYLPKSVRLLAISGVPIPIQQITIQSGREYQEIVGYNNVKISEEIPEMVIVDNVTRQISNLNDKYCYDEKCIENGLNNQYIADGPVVVAQEVESFSSFSAGVARSRITLISDSSLVQGRFMSDEFGRMSANTVSFIRSLYPETSFPSNVFGKQYIEFTKIVAPERGSPQKYLALSGINGCVSRFGGAGAIASLGVFDNKESLYDPRYVKRTELPWPKSAPEEIKRVLRQEEIDKFDDDQYDYGGTARFSGVIDSVLYTDAGIKGGIPSIMQNTGYDYIDFQTYPSGYPGDLFGYSVSLHKNKLVVGSPFTAFVNENIKNWDHYSNPNNLKDVSISHNGGAGSVYVYEKTFKGSGIRNTITPWEFTQKLRPNSINVGQDLVSNVGSDNYTILGPNSYSDTYLAHNSFVTDMFGYDVSIDSDTLTVGAPGHDFGNHIISNSGEFIRKCFNEEFYIPQRTVIDLGNSGVRNSIQSGIAVLNNGAVFAFENKLYDWTNRKQKWTLIEKIIPQGINSREQLLPSGNENDYFGHSIYINRSNRSDSDYAIVIGSQYHKYSSSGTNPISTAGVVYTHDIMLRNSAPALPNPNSYIDAKVFGERDTSGQPTVRLITSNNNLNSQTQVATGIVYSDDRGSVFIEASGQDPSSRGFIQHRPFIVSVDGLYVFGVQNSGNIPLFIDASVEKYENMNVFVNATTGNVYNAIGLNTSSIVDFGSGILNFYLDCPEPTQIIASGLPLIMASGIGLSTDSVNLRIRGY